MVWFTLWFMVILKIPILYLAYVIWWAVKDPPDAYSGPAADDVGDGDGPGWRPSRGRGPLRRPRRGPHGAPERRPARVVLGRGRARV
jgi:hypothetical protein